MTVTDESAAIVQWRVTDALPGEATTWLTSGGVASYLKVIEADAELPALSLHVPDREALSVAGPS